MARYILAPGEDRSNRSKQGSTFTRNATQFIIRTKRVPTLKYSRKQSKAANLFGSLSSQHRNLTSGQQSNWQTESANFPRVNSLGNPYLFNGLNMMIGSNANLRNSGAAQIPAPAAGGPAPSLNISAIFSNLSATNLQVLASVLIVPAGYHYRLFASRPVTQMPPSPSIRDMKLLYTVGAGGNTLANIYFNYLNAYPGITWVPGQNIFFVFSQMEDSIGQWSEPTDFQQSVIS